jgi:hypothetical protein
MCFGLGSWWFLMWVFLLSRFLYVLRIEALIVKWKVSYVWLICRDSCGMIYLRFRWLDWCFALCLVMVVHVGKLLLFFWIEVFVCGLALGVHEFVFEYFYNHICLEDGCSCDSLLIMWKVSYVSKIVVEWFIRGLDGLIDILYSIKLW